MNRPDRQGVLGGGFTLVKERNTSAAAIAFLSCETSGAASGYALGRARFGELKTCQDRRASL